MQVEGAVWRHVPYRFGQHAESHHNEHVGMVGSEGFEEGWVAELLGLQQWQVVRQSVVFHGTVDDFLSAAGLTVGHGDNGGHLVARLYYGVEALHGEIGCPEENDAHLI